MTTFIKSVDFVLDHEKEWSRDQLGGITKWGFAQKYNTDIDVATLQRDGAIKRYRERYWNPCRCDELPGILRLAVLDAAVNTGQDNSIRFLQQALRVKVDGVIGPVTLAKAGIADMSTLPAILTERSIYYSTRAGFVTYGHGWIQRCFDLQQFVLRDTP